MGQRVLSRAQRKGVDLARLPFVPRALVLPLQRDGVDPVEQLRHTREADPVTRLTRMFGMNIWLVTGHQATRAVLADTSRYSNDIRHLVGRNASEPERDIGGLGFTDPPDHTRLRRILTPEFTMRRLERLKPRIQRIVDDQLDAVEAAGPVADLVPLFAFPIPFLVISELLGLPDDDRQRFQRLGHARFDVSRGGIGSLGAVSESRSFFIDVVRRQRAHPTDGLIGQIIEQHGDDIDDIELAGLADGVFTGGYETSASMLALGALVLLQDEGGLAALRDDDAVGPIVEELLRHLAVVQISFPRFAREDLVLFGHRVSAGDVVVCSLSGANRDAALGLGMEGFDVGRPPTAHVAFGHGLHRCIGAELARMELRAAFPALARRFPGLQLAVDPANLRFRELSIVYGVESLPVRLR
ncbi:MAG: cytochrome P450 [Propionibacteriales bacterium]|nr:cytochrome P450 [Propionibacteriales bacterium]